MGTAARAQTVRVRQVRPGDREAWIELRAALFPTESRDALAREVAEFFAPRSGQTARWGVIPRRVLVAEGESDRIDGFLELSLRPVVDGCESSPVGYLEEWYVRPQVRRTGVGGALVRAGEAWARDLGCREIASDTDLDNVVSIAVHGRLGYAVADRVVRFRRRLD